MKSEYCDMIDTAVEDQSLTVQQYAEIFQLQNSILELIALGTDESEIFRKLCRMEETLVPGALASIMLFDENSDSMYVLEAPSIPEEGKALLNSLRPGPCAGSCGNVIYRREAQFVDDIENDRRWDDLREVANAFGLGSCWSVPIRTDESRIVGTFALTSFEKRSPDHFHKNLLEIGAFIAGILLKRGEHKAKISEHEQRINTLGAAFENAYEGIMITDSQNRIIEVNKAFETIFGYTPEEVYGKNPRILASGRHDSTYYDTMWSSLKEKKYWNGEISNRRKDGVELTQWISISVISHPITGEKNYLAVTLDISALKDSEEKLTYMAFHDPLTGMANRTKLFDRIDQFIKRSKRSPSIAALLYLDLDRFKNLNDSMGHIVGDHILVEISERLASRIRGHDLIARVGGDEFVIWLEDLHNVSEAEIVAQKLLNLFDEPFVIESREYFLQGSIGISLFPQDAKERDSLLRNADAAMYRAKEDTKRKIMFYRLQMTQQAKTSLRLESELYSALKNHEFELYYQPKIDARTGELHGAEALIRWNHPEKGMVMPGEFISFAEQTSLISQIGEYVLEKVFEQFRTWRMLSGLPFTLSVNLSGRQLNEDDLQNILKIIGVNIDLAPYIVIELTETFLMHHAHSAVNMLEQLKQSGVRLSIDDFGTGYSSLGYLKRFKVDELKIDRLLINDIEKDSNDRIISSAVIAMAHTLGLFVVAEGVETGGQAAILRESGCDQFQGFLFDRPLSAEAFFKKYLEGR